MVLVNPSIQIRVYWVLCVNSPESKIRFSGTLRPQLALEYAITRFAPKLLLVLGEMDSQVVANAIAKARGAPPTSNGVSILDRVMVSATRAIQQVELDSATSAAGRELKIRHLATELNVLYTIERILKNSAIVRNAVREHGLELHMDGL